MSQQIERSIEDESEENDVYQQIPAYNAFYSWNLDQTTDTICPQQMTEIIKDLHDFCSNIVQQAKSIDNKQEEQTKCIELVEEKKRLSLFLINKQSGLKNFVPKIYQISSNTISKICQFINLIDQRQQAQKEQIKKKNEVKQYHKCFERNQIMSEARFNLFGRNHVTQNFFRKYIMRM